MTEDGIEVDRDQFIKKIKKSLFGKGKSMPAPPLPPEFLPEKVSDAEIISSALLCRESALRTQYLTPSFENENEEQVGALADEMEELHQLYLSHGPEKTEDVARALRNEIDRLEHFNDVVAYHGIPYQFESHGVGKHVVHQDKPYERFPDGENQETIQTGRLKTELSLYVEFFHG